MEKLFLMTYNWHWPGGPAGPIAPISEIRPVLKYAVSVVPRYKLMLGLLLQEKGRESPILHNEQLISL